MKREITLGWLAGAFVLGMLATGMHYWTASYDALDGASGLLLGGFILVGVATALPVVFGRANPLLAFFVVSASVPAAVILRVGVDVTIDPTSHNLWPFEVVLMGLAGAGAAGLGALAGWLLTKIGGSQQ